MAATESQILTSTTVLKSEQVADGEWKLTEIKSDPPAEQDLHSGNRKELQFDLAFGIGVSHFPHLQLLGQDSNRIADWRLLRL